MVWSASGFFSTTLEYQSWPDRADGQNARAKKIEHLKTKKKNSPKKKIEKREKTKNKNEIKINKSKKDNGG